MAKGRNVQARYRHIKWVLSLWLIEEWTDIAARLAERKPTGRRTMLKDLAAQHLKGERCHFCKGALIRAQRPGEGKTSWWMRVEFTVHHINGNHDDDRSENHAMAHADCHKRHHLLERKAAARAAKAS